MIDGLCIIMTLKIRLDYCNYNSINNYYHKHKKSKYDANQNIMLELELNLKVKSNLLVKDSLS